MPGFTLIHSRRFVAFRESPTASICACRASPAGNNRRAHGDFSLPFIHGDPSVLVWESPVAFINASRENNRAIHAGFHSDSFTETFFRVFRYSPTAYTNASHASPAGKNGRAHGDFSLSFIERDFVLVWESPARGNNNLSRWLTEKPLWKKKLSTFPSRPSVSSLCALRRRPRGTVHHRGV